jgi:hypothetical protein
MAQKDTKREPWQDIMVDVTRMMKEALEQAHEVISQYVDKGKAAGESTRKIPSADSVFRMAVSIFDATAQAEGGRRMIDAQKKMNIDTPLIGGKLLSIGPDGRPIHGGRRK